MGLQDREYLKGTYQRPGGAIGMSMVQLLIIINVVVAVLDGILLGSQRGNAAAPLLWGYFSFEKAFQDFQIWRVFTYQFLHGGVMHLLCNMLGLYFFGPLMEGYWGKARFLAFYLLAGVAGAVVMSVLSFVPGLLMSGPATPLVGASGALFGVLAGSAALYPNMVVRLLFPPVDMRMKTLISVYFGIILLSLVAGSANAGGEACHLGGALVGFLLIRNPQWLSVFNTGSNWKNKSRDSKKASAYGDVGTARRADIDRILDKISAEGMHSLTAEEKRTLESARDDLR